MLVELGDGDVALRGAALLLERLTLGVESVALGLQAPDGLFGFAGRGSPGQVGDPVAQGAEALPEAADISVDCQSGLTTRASGSCGSRPRTTRASRLNSSRIYLKKFSCDQRENRAPAICSTGMREWVEMSGTWRPLSSRRRIWRTSGPCFSCTRFSARRTVALRVAPGPWMGTETVWNSASGQSSPLKPLCQVITATPRRARRLNSAGLQPP